MSVKMLRTFRLAIASVMIGLAATAQAGNLLVAGSPGYDPATKTGLKDGSVPYAPGWGVNNSGTAVGCPQKFDNNTYKGYRAVRWDATGTAATELGNLGIDSSGTDTEAYAVNASGTAVGYSEKYVGGSSKGDRAVRWDASGTSATELGNLGTDNNGETLAEALAVNNSGTAVGISLKYITYSNKGERAVRWDASGTTATELGNLGTNSSGHAETYAYAVNDSGMAVGCSEKYDVSGSYVGISAVRWDASGTAATELGNLGTNSSGSTTAVCYAVNDAGTAVGNSYKFFNGGYMGDRAVRWDASGTAATELGILGTDSSGKTYATAYAVNVVGTAVGYSEKYDVSGSNKGSRAVIWLPDASAIDLNDLGVAPVPAGGTWTLTTAKAISADGWVSGEGTFDPDGNGPLAGYTRLWVAQVGLGGTWNNVASGTWGRGPNWSTGTPAMQVGNATFNLNLAYTVALDRDELTKNIAINAGTVTIDFNSHTLTTESGLNISNGATLKGTGTLISDITNAGIIAPGNSPGTLNINGSLTNSNTLEFEIAGLSSHDNINVSGAFSAAGTIVVKLLDGYTPADGDIFNLMTFGSFADSGYVFDFFQAGLPGDLRWDTANFASTGSISVVPEPGTLMLLGTAGLGLLIYVWRGRNRLRR